MSPEDAITLLNSKFVYTPDKKDRWTILKGVVSDEKVYGDCEDYALTLAWLMSEKKTLKLWFNILLGKMTIWYYNHKNVGHAVLKHNDLFADNIKRAWVKELGQDYKPRFPYYSFLALAAYLMK